MPWREALGSHDSYWRIQCKIAASLQVLLVEDNPGDVRLTLEAFRDANPSIRLHVASDGVEAMAFLRHEGFTSMPRARISSCWI